MNLHLIKLTKKLNFRKRFKINFDLTLIFFFDVKINENVVQKQYAEFVYQFDQYFIH